MINLFILCGGNGKRLDNYSLPKPLNLINGKPMIYYTLSQIPDEIKTINFIVNKNLQNYNFNEIVINLFPTKNCNFYYLSYFTRGPIETAYIGIKNFNLDFSSGSLVFLDNDNLYSFPENFFNNYSEPFIGYYINNENSSAYSFININNQNQVINIKEKIKISNLVCCGVYGFKDIKQFLEIAHKVLINNHNSKEFYMSLLYNEFLNQNIIIKAIEFPEIKHIGTYNELNQKSITLPKMRVCFDLDNTLVSYPSIPNDYSTVKPITNMIELLKKMKNDGHIIIIHTARRMKTHNNNIGAVIADIGKITFETLDKFQIPYDEIIFGKPLADIYIDDRAINPYLNNINAMGYLNYNNIELPINKLNNNSYNTIKIINNQIIKSGNLFYLEGELYYYKYLVSINDETIKSFFPIYYTNYIDNNNLYIYRENIEGIPLYTLYKNEMITVFHLSKLFDMINYLHNYKNDNIIINNNDIIDNYSTKLEERFKITKDYNFEDFDIIKNECLKRLDNYYKDCKYNFNICNLIHGDLWFSNIIIDYSNNIKFIDMKGKNYKTLTTNGHNLYDYAKLYQSFLGYDTVLYNDDINQDYKIFMINYYEDYIKSININLEHLKTITFSLVIGTMHAINDEDTKLRVWKWIRNTFL